MARIHTLGGDSIDDDWDGRPRRLSDGKLADGSEDHDDNDSDA